MPPYMDIGSKVEIRGIQAWHTRKRDSPLSPADVPVPLQASLRTQ